MKEIINQRNWLGQAEHVYLYGDLTNGIRAFVWDDEDEGFFPYADVTYGTPRKTDGAFIIKTYGEYAWFNGVLANARELGLIELVGAAGPEMYWAIIKPEFVEKYCWTEIELHEHETEASKR